MTAPAPKYYVIAETPCPACDGAKIRTRRSIYDGKPYPQDYDCDRCNGKGVIETRVPLEDALREFEVSGSIFQRGLE